MDNPEQSQRNDQISLPTRTRLPSCLPSDWPHA